MSNYYVTQSGAGAADGTVGNPWSVATYNSSGSAPTAGDTVYFTGTITSTITLASSGTGNGASRVNFDFSGATLNTANPAINVNGRDYANLLGGGLWSAGTFTPGCIVGARDAGAFEFIISFNNATSNDVTVSGFQDILSANSATSYHSFMWTNHVTNLVVTQNYVKYCANFILGDKVLSHDLTLSNNYVETNINTVGQSDIIFLGDAYNVTIEGNKFIHNTPGANIDGRHNDIIQSYRNGGSDAAYPTGWVIRYNWFESKNASLNSDGNSSISQMESMDGASALKVYGNVFVGIAGSTATNGFDVYGGVAPTVYFYNNTFISSSGAPGNATTFTTGTLYNRNNIYMDDTTTYSGTATTWTMTEAGGGNGWDYNYFYRWNTQTNPAGGNGSSVTDPLLTNLGTKDYSLQSGSPCKGTGDSTIGAEYNQGIAYGATWPNPTLVTRTVAWDIGAYQFIAGVGVTAPIRSSRRASIFARRFH